MAGRIMRADLDGSNVRTVVDEGLMDPGLYYRISRVISRTGV